MQPGNPHIAGNRLPIQESEEIEISSTEAPRIRKIYRGTRDQMKNSLQQLASGGTRAVYRQQGAVATVEVTSQSEPGDPNYSANDIRSNQLSRSSAQQQVEIFDAPYFEDLDVFAIAVITDSVNRFLGVSESDAATRKTALDQVLDDFYDYFNINDSANYEAARVAFDLLVSKAQPPIVFLPVLEYRTVYASQADVEIAASEEGTVFATNSLPIPSDMLGRIDTPNVATTLALRQHHGFGWLKSASMSTQADGSIEIVETYTYGAYPTIYYPGTYDQTA